MDILLVQFDDPQLPEPPPRFDNALGIAAALMRREGFEPHLLTLGAFDPKRLGQAVAARRPRYAVVDIDPYSVSTARRTIGELAGTYALPVVVVGRYATCKPEEALSAPGTQALVLGEYESALCGYLHAAEAGEDPIDLPGVWVNGAEGLVRGEVPALPGDLDALPYADRELFDGGRPGGPDVLDVKACRGCPQWCAYCINDWYMDIHEDRGTFVRRRSVEHVLGELRELADRYPQAQAVRFLDHAFAMDLEWLRAFADGYPSACPLPYHCHARLNRIDAETVALLALSNCGGVTVTLGSGSSFIRDEVFTMQTDAAHVEEGFRLLRQAGLAVTAEVLVGAPYESEITVEETIRCLRELNPDGIDARVFYPTPGSRTAEMCHEAGWVSGRGEDHYWRQFSTLDMPSLPAERINELARGLVYAVKHPRNSRFMQVLSRIRVSRKASLYDMLHGRRSGAARPF